VRAESLLPEQHYHLHGPFPLLFLSWWRCWKIYISDGRVFPKPGRILVTKGPISPLSESHFIAGLSYDVNRASYFLLDKIYICGDVSLAL
jgi:hypothetical protein